MLKNKAQKLYPNCKFKFVCITDLIENIKEISMGGGGDNSLYTTILHH